MKALRKIIEIDETKCDGCGLCVPSCAEGAIRIEDGKARLVAEKFCDGLGACLGECPQGALRIVEREVDVFDEAAVHEHLKASITATESPMPCGCPSTLIRTFAPAPKPAPREKSGRQDAASSLTHWPIQIKLVPPHAPFLRNADLLVAADCTPAAYPRFHEDFLAGKVMLLGCPKLDDVQEYVQKFARIFAQNDIRSVTALVMEVPCCQGLPAIVEQGMRLAGKNVPIGKVVIGISGKVMKGTEALSQAR